ncbi:Capsule polysaccharide biosynthesis protein [Roseovarius albus]|uniref:Capsule polysaccharide biosynthesis protein n=2 Tax=Roseovarius albus TaxID=1247867 RepID=A0A1X6Z8S5_9RHOB|nr:Capsule polysaccharide biosynthesis protein [Roseovarius albus]
MDAKRVFLFLQGPHGPFFHKLGKMLECANAKVWRVGFNAGDQLFWPSRHNYIPFQDDIDTWSEWFSDLLSEKYVTDLVLYGDVRRIHAEAVELAKERGLRVHVFEEGYMRPYWVTYERGGSNGHSRLMDMNIEDMRDALAHSDIDSPVPPASWGDMRQHVFYGATYHGAVLCLNGKYENFSPHRSIGVSAEFRLHFKRLLLMPYLSLKRHLATLQIKRGSFPYHLVLLQLEHDASFQAHSPFSSISEFLEMVIKGFADGAPGHHHLVIKTHPLEDGRSTFVKDLKTLTKDHDVEGRVHIVRGGKLAGLLDQSRSAVTVNSTAAQQVLWRGIPLKTFGDAVYAKPEFVSTQHLPEFFSAPDRPDRRAYVDYRQYLLETSQIAGGFYSTKGRRQLLRQAVDMMLADEDPYDALRSGTASPRQQLHISA